MPDTNIIAPAGPAEHHDHICDNCGYVNDDADGSNRCTRCNAENFVVPGEGEASIAAPTEPLLSDPEAVKVAASAAPAAPIVTARDIADPSQAVVAVKTPTVIDTSSRDESMQSS